MGNLVNLRHIVTNKAKSLDSQFVKDLYEVLLGENILRSHIYYQLNPKYIRIEYVAKSISNFIFENKILLDESIITIYSSDFGLADSYIIFDSTFKGEFRFKRTYFEFDEIEIEGSSREISNFLNYLYKTNHIKHNSEKWSLNENGTIQMNTHNHQMLCTNHKTELITIEVKHKNESLIENDFELISISNTNQTMSERFVSCFYNLINKPEEFSELRRLKLIKQGKIIAMIEFETENGKWKMLQQNDLIPFVSNNEFTNELKKIAYS